MQDPDLVADATEPIDGAEPEITETTMAEPAALDRRPDVRPTHQGVHLIGGTDLPVVPGDHEVQAIAQLAVTIAGAATAPRALQDNVNDAFMVLLTARDVGVGLTTAVREFHVIDGKVTLSPKVKNAMVKQQGHGRTFPHQAPRPDPTEPERMIICPCGSHDPANDDERATWHAERADEPGILHSSTFTMDMARRVKAKESGAKITLADKSTWKQYPQRMLSWRALGYLLDDVFPEVGTGLYSPDELGAVTDDEGVPIIDVVGHAEPVMGTSAPRGHNTPPPPPEPPATDDQIQALQDRIAALGQTPDARAALLALWTKPRSDDNPEPTLPPLKHLMAKQVKIADAMVASIEQRLARGEWGESPQAEPPPEGDEPGPAAEPSVDEQPTDEPTVEPTDDVAPADDADPVQLVIAEVKAMDAEQVDDHLARRQLDTSGRLDTRRHRLATALIAERQAA